MTHLLAIAIGPVQDFIAAARRTADLQAGSELLVDIAQHIAGTLHKEGAGLIFPADIENDGPNKLLVTVPDGVDPRALAALVKRSAVDMLLDKWSSALTALGAASPTMRSHVHEARATNQLGQFLEFYAAWLPLEDGTYAETRQLVERLLAGRKSVREFEQPESGPGRPKSPLDPSRDSVLTLQSTHPYSVTKACARRPLWLKPMETLDAVSLLKRVRGVLGEPGRPKTPSTSEMAARIATRSPNPQVQEAVRSLEVLGLGMMQYLDLDLDLGDLMFPNRLQEQIEDLDRDSLTMDAKETVGEYLDVYLPRIAEQRILALQAAGIQGGTCPPYYVVLAADGDRMGKLLNKLHTKTQHIQFSQQLSQFAVWARECVRNHDGHPVYAGGDDVLGLLPLHTAVECAADLADEFRRCLNVVKRELQLVSSENAGTLSVGLAIVHHTDPLQVCIERARQAEHAAKRTRNALAVALHTRGGEPLTVASRWTAPRQPLVERQDEGTDESSSSAEKYRDDEAAQGQPAAPAPRAEWRSLMQAMHADLSRGFPYELRTLAREWRGVSIAGDRLSCRLREEARRVLERKRGGKADDAASLQLLLEQINGLQTPDDLEQLAKKLVIARFLTAEGTCMPWPVQSEVVPAYSASATEQDTPTEMARKENADV